MVEAKRRQQQQEREAETRLVSQQQQAEEAEEILLQRFAQAKLSEAKAAGCSNLASVNKVRRKRRVRAASRCLRTPTPSDAGTVVGLRSPRPCHPWG